MLSDPLIRPVEEWSRTDLDELIGREESLRLELKGSDTNLSSGSGRRKIAREIAAMQSESGGYVIVGTEPGSDVVTAFPGITIERSDVESLRRSLLDLVRPVSLIRGPVMLPADDESSAVLVIEVFPHPAGLPAHADGKFWTRVDSETRPMSYDEVRRRFEELGTDLGPLRERARTALNDVSKPISEGVQKGALERGVTAPDYRPIAVALIPRHPVVDFGRSGRDLRALLQNVGVKEFAHSFSTGLDKQGSALHDNAIATASGVLVPLAPFEVLQYGHDAVFARAEIGILDPWAGDTGQSLSPASVETAVVRSIAVGLRMITEVAGPAEVLVLATSGTIPGSIDRYTTGSLPIAGDPAREPGTIANVEFLTSSQGLQAAEAVASGAKLLAQRIYDAGTYESVYVQGAAVIEYLEAVLVSTPSTPGRP